MNDSLQAPGPLRGLTPPAPEPTRSAVNLLTDQRRRWEGGDRVRVEEILRRHPPLPIEAALDLIYQEVLLREEAGEEPQLEEYLGRFPELAAELRAQFAVHRAVEAGPSLAAPLTLSSPPSGERGEGEGGADADPHHEPFLFFPAAGRRRPSVAGRL